MYVGEFWAENVNKLLYIISYIVFDPIIVLRAMPVIFTFGPIIYNGLCP